MNAQTLFYSRKKLLGFGLLTLFLGLTILPIAYQMSGTEGFHKLKEAYVLYAFGANGPRYGLAVFGLLFAFAGTAALVRAAGDREAATIRLDGIRLLGLLRSRTIPWKYLESVALTETRYRDKVYQRLVVRSRRLPGESKPAFLLGRRFSILADRLDATGTDIATWVRAAEAARRQALLYPPVQPMRPAPGMFGRRA